jgi:dihydropteroate synthase
MILMHAQGVPATMQDDPRYGDVLLDVYDALAARLARAEALGIDRARIMLDPGIGFGKTQAHNLTLLRGLSLFHGLGCPILLGTSRKRFIGSIGGPTPQDRAPGSIATALARGGAGGAARPRA